MTSIAIASPSAPVPTRAKAANDPGAPILKGLIAAPWDKTPLNAAAQLIPPRIIAAITQAPPFAHGRRPRIEDFIVACMLIAGAAQGRPVIAKQVTLATQRAPGTARAILAAFVRRGLAEDSQRAGRCALFTPTPELHERMNAWAEATQQAWNLPTK